MDPAVRDDGHGQGHRRVRGSRRIASVWPTPIGGGCRRAIHPATSPLGLRSSPHGHANQEVDEEERAHGPDRPEQLVEVGVDERDGAECHGDACSGSGLMFVHDGRMNLPALDDAPLGDAVGLGGHATPDPPSRIGIRASYLSATARRIGGRTGQPQSLTWRSGAAQFTEGPLTIARQVTPVTWPRWSMRDAGGDCWR